MKILGFGLMRPPMIGDAPDLEQVSKMVDLFLANGFTYFDTARAYMDGGNERMMRAALVERYPRECYTIADKLPIWLMKSKGFSAEEIFAQSLENSGAGYFDYYLLHAMSADNVQYADENGLWDFMKKLKAEGRVREIGFSFHDTPEVLEEILTKHPEMEFVQLQINYADWENPSVQSRRCYEVARSFGKPVVIMEPVKGGTLAELGAETAALFDGVAPEVGLPARALRFAASLPGVRAVLSGMSTLAQMEENTATLAEVPVLSEAEQAAYTAVRDWCAVENSAFGVALVQFDSSLTEFGEIHPDKTCCSFGKYEGPSSIYSYLFTDWLQMHNPDGESFNPVFRYAITSYAGGWQDAHLPSLARETVNSGLVGLEKRVRAEAGNVRLVGLKAAEDGDGFIVRFKETEGRTVKTGIVQDLLKGARITPVDTLENPKDGAVAGEFAPYAMHAFRITDGRRVVFAAPTDDGFAYTGLITAPRATHGEADGHIYLIWGACTDANFGHYELERAEGDSNDFRFVANVRNETHDGVAYRCARYEDLGLKNHTRYAYRIRRVFRDGRKGEWSETVRCLTRQSGADAACDAKMLEFR